MRVPPAAPAGGGRAPVYASRGCQQRAYRARLAARVPAADPPSVAGLLAAVRLGAALDAGTRPDPGQVTSVRDGTTALLACVPHEEPAPGVAATETGADLATPRRPSTAAPDHPRGPADHHPRRPR